MDYLALTLAGRRWLEGLELPVLGPRRFGLRQHFLRAPWTDRVEVHLSRSGEAYVTPQGHLVSAQGIALFAPDSEFGFADLARDYFEAGAGAEKQAAAKRKGRSSVPSWDEIMFGGSAKED